MITKAQASRLEDHAGWIARVLQVAATDMLITGRMTPAEQAHIRRCHHDSDLTRTRIIFTRDTGHHSSGWMKNPDYERCFHLSLSEYPADVITRGHLLEFHEPRTQALWLRAFFGEHARLTWCETAKSPEGIKRGVLHWRLFADAHWKPILPRGEVYSTEFTEKGWKSASELGNLITSPLDPT